MIKLAMLKMDNETYKLFQINKNTFLVEREIDGAYLETSIEFISYVGNNKIHINSIEYNILEIFNSIELIDKLGYIKEEKNTLVKECKDDVYKYILKDDNKALYIHLKNNKSIYEDIVSINKSELLKLGYKATN